MLHIGLSEASAKTIRRAHAILPVSAVQTEYSLMIRDVEKNGVFRLAKMLRIGFVPWGPVGQGFLTRKLMPKLGSIRSWKWLDVPSFSPVTISANPPIIELVKEFAGKMNATAAQLSLAWLLARKPFHRADSWHAQNIDHLNEKL